MLSINASTFLLKNGVPKVVSAIPPLMHIVVHNRSAVVFINFKRNKFLGVLTGKAHLFVCCRRNLCLAAINLVTVGPQRRTNSLWHVNSISIVEILL